jgi:LPXTG-motif cell wall-anchored protein
VHIAAKFALVAASVVALSGVSTAAYAAAPVDLPAGDTIYQVNYNGDPAAVWTTASDGTATVIGTPSTTLEQVVDGAWNPATNRAYIIVNGYEGPCELWEVALATGDVTFVATITGGNGDTFNCDAFDIAPDGTAWVTMYDGDTPTLAKLNLADGTTTDAVAITGASEISWIVIHPTTGVVYLGSFAADLYTIDPTTGVATFVESASVGDSVYDAAFDSAGRLWLTSWPDNTELLSADVADFAASIVSQGFITVGGSGDNTGTDSLMIVRGPAPAVLASTGLDATMPLVAGLGLLVLGAGALAIRRTRHA